MRRIVALGAAVALLLLSTGAVQAAALVTSQTTTTTLPPETGLTDGCLPNATGTLTGTAVVTDLIVETATSFHVTETEVDSGRVDWSNGDYTIIGSTDHVTFDASLQGTTVLTHPHTDFGDFYSADGVFLFRETFQEVEHFTFANGVMTVQFDKSHFLVFGSSCTPG